MTNEDAFPEPDMDFSRGYGRAIYGVSTLLALGASLVILFIYVSFLSWAASGIIYYSELAASVLSTLGLLVGLIFFWSPKAIFSYIVLASSATVVFLGGTVLLGTLSRDKGSTSGSNVIFVALPVALAFMASALSYFKSSQLSKRDEVML